MLRFPTPVAAATSFIDCCYLCAIVKLCATRTSVTATAEYKRATRTSFHRSDAMSQFGRSHVKAKAKIHGTKLSEATPAKFIEIVKTYLVPQEKFIQTLRTNSEVVPSFCT